MPFHSDFCFRSLTKYLDKATKSLYQDASGKWMDGVESKVSGTSAAGNLKRKHEDSTQDEEYRFVEVADSEANDAVVIKQEKVTREEIYGRVPEFHKASIKPVTADPILKKQKQL